MALLLLVATATPVAAQTAGAGLDISVDPSGHYTVQSHAPELAFGGDVGQPLSNLRSTDGQDALGAFHEVDFDYAARTSGIRAYLQTPVVLFTTTYVGGGPNSDPFPQLKTLPSLPYTLSYHDTPFSPYQLNTLADASDSPWLFFDASGSGFLISPAANFPVARMTLGNAGLSSGIDPAVAKLPAGYTHQTLLVTGSGPNQVFDTWGAAMLAQHAQDSSGQRRRPDAGQTGLLDRQRRDLLLPLRAAARLRGHTAGRQARVRPARHRAGLSAARQLVVPEGPGHALG